MLKTSESPVGSAPEDAEKAVKLVCFHHAGAGASTFIRWRALLPEAIDLVRVQLPGREGDDAENAFQEIKPLISYLLPDLERLFDRPVAFYGHSLGALVAFEAACALRRGGMPSVVALFVASRRAPQLPLSHLAYGLAREQELIYFLRQMGGMPEAILSKQHWRDQLFPVLRRDLIISDLYEYTPEQPLSCPIFFFGGRKDTFVSPHEREAWRHQTTSEFHMHTLDSGHIFAAKDQNRVVQKIVSYLHCRLTKNHQSSREQLAF